MIIISCTNCRVNSRPLHYSERTIETWNGTRNGETAGEAAEQRDHDAVREEKKLYDFDNG